MNIRIFVNPENQYLLYGALEFALENPRQALWLAYYLGENNVTTLFFNHAKTTNLDIEYIGNVTIESNLTGIEIYSLIIRKIEKFESDKTLNEGLTI